MPNIELHGFGSKNSVEVIEMRAKVFGLFFSKEEILKEMVVTTYSDEVRDCVGRDQPFIRLVTTIRKDLTWIVAQLRSLYIDVEVMLLNDFFPKS